MKTIDWEHFTYCSALKVQSAYGTNNNEWICHAADFILLVKYTSGVLSVGISETENEMGHKMRMVAISDSAGVISFNQIKEYFLWDTPNDQIWDFQ